MGRHLGSAQSKRRGETGEAAAEKLFFPQLEFVAVGNAAVRSENQPIILHSVRLNHRSRRTDHLRCNISLCAID
ncbi:hypothetical protein [Methylobacterium sp. PvR107]|uniref:hypothetical protein n=1 Tax=Methylobacterium sp. PvR107 TaxID=2806597 RepID=UPI001AE510BC|nr:hypothetical protein [Methylobacterium sp. PvR107]MBP1179557.1 hypothetical protein [Methylobacterium sp. PvR107]